MYSFKKSTKADLALAAEVSKVISYVIERLTSSSIH